MLVRDPVQASKPRRINSLWVTVVFVLISWAGLGGGWIVVELLSGESMKLLVLSQQTPPAVGSRSSCSWDFRSVELGEELWGRALIGPRSVGHGGVFSAMSRRRPSVGCGWLSRSGSRTNEMHRTQDSYESVSCNCREECSLEASACAWGVGDLGCRSAAKPCRLPMMFCGRVVGE